MASARHLQGTVLERITGLLKTGVLKTPPLWLDVVERFMPDNPASNRAVPEGRPANIVYPQDDIRREARVKVPEFTKEALNLFEIKSNDIHPFFSSMAETYVKRYEELLETGIDKEECLARCLHQYESELKHKRKSKGKTRRGTGGKAIEKAESSENESGLDNNEDLHSLLGVENRPTTNE